MKKMLFALLTGLLLLLALSGAALADTGPKPSVVVDFKGLEGETYYATLLSKEAVSGPWIVSDEPSDWQEPKEIWEKFNGFHDADGYYFIGNFSACDETQSFRWGYFPPQTFKLLLYFPAYDRLIVSAETYDRYAFDSYFTANCEGLNPATADGLPPLSVVESYDYGAELLSLLCRVVLTIGIELLLALLFRFRAKKQIKLILLTNLATQILLNVALNLAAYFWGGLLLVGVYLVLEPLVFLAEGLIYRKRLPSHAAQPEDQSHPWLYALTANICSFAAGLALSVYLPGIF